MHDDRKIIDEVPLAILAGEIVAVNECTRSASVGDDKLVARRVSTNEFIALILRQQLQQLVGEFRARDD